MKINTRKIKKLLKENFSNNQTQMAKTLGIERTHLNKVLRNGGNGAGGILCGAIIKYCEDNKLDFREFIFLE